MTLSYIDIDAITWLDEIGEVWRGKYGKYRPAGAAPNTKYIYSNTIGRLIDFGYAERDPHNPDRVMRTKKIG